MANPTTYAEAVPVLARPGSSYEIIPAEVDDRPIRWFRHAPTSLFEVFRAVVDSLEAAGSDRDYLVYRDERLTYREAAVRVRDLASFLQFRGVQQGDRVAIGMRNYPEWVISFWATLYVGAIAVPLNAWWTGPELEWAIGHSEPKVLVVDGERFDRLRPYTQVMQPLTSILVRADGDDGVSRDGGSVVTSWGGDSSFDFSAGDVVVWSEALADGRRREVAPVINDLDATATLLYTSGTTGRPKAAMGSHRNHLSNLWCTRFGRDIARVRNGLDPFGGSARLVEPQPSWLQVFPYFHIGGMTGLYTSTADGAKIVTLYKWDTDKAINTIRSEAITGTSLVPTLLRQLLASPRVDELRGTSLAGISSGGAPVPGELISALGERFSRGVAPANGYGMTETTSAICSNSGADYFDSPTSVGRVAVLNEVRIVDEGGSELPDDEIGELWARGPNVVAGYWRDPEASAAAFHDGWFRTGDLGYRHHDQFYVVDRIKDVVVRGGENVYSAEVEIALAGIEEIADVAVIGLPDEVYGEIVAAVVVPSDVDNPISLPSIRDRLRGALAEFKLPSRLFIHPGPLPRNATEKLLKNELRTWAEAQDEDSAAR